jgi:hypothetical protein
VNDLLDELQLFPNPVHQSIQAQTQFCGNRDVLSIVIQTDLLDLFESDSVALVENVETGGICSCSQDDVNKLVWCYLQCQPGFSMRT